MCRSRNENVHRETTAGESHLFQSVPASITHTALCVVLARDKRPDGLSAMPSRHGPTASFPQLLYTNDQSLHMSNTSVGWGEILFVGNTPDHTLWFYLLFCLLSSIFHPLQFHPFLFCVQLKGKIQYFGDF